MIPRRIKLSGFLSYKDEQAIDFDGSALWMLAGLNGSGKSTVFDAVTYSLFGQHRGGATGAQELINKESNGLSVEFEFGLDGRVFQAKRTLKRTKQGGSSGTQQIARWVAEGDNGSGRWQAEPDTGRKVEFDKWVREKIGLNYDTFTSSVLLLQGKAERLLDSSPKGRSEVLAGIVDLERYQKLHERGDNLRREYKAKLEDAQVRAANVAEVTDEQLAAAADRIAGAETTRRLAHDEAERLQQLEYRAKQHAELLARLGERQQRWEQSRGLLAEADAIEKDFRRLRELREVLPHVNAVIAQRTTVTESERTTAKLTAEQKSASEKLEATGLGLEQAKQKRTALQKRLADDEGRQRALDRQLRDLAGVLAQVKIAEKQQSDLTAVENDLSRLPADPAAGLERAQQVYEQREALGRVLPHLERMHTQRHELRQAQGRLEQAEQEEQTTRARGEKLRREFDDRDRRAKQAKEAARSAADQAVEAKTLLDQAQTAVKEFATLGGAKVCRHCGQDLTPGHYEEERARRDRELKAAKERHQKASAADQAARREEQALAEQAKQCDEQLKQLREEFRGIQQNVKHARGDIDRAAGDCRNAYMSLPEPFRSKVGKTAPADWAATEYPSRADVIALKQEAGELETARRALKSAREVQERWAGLTAKADNLRQSLDGLRAALPAEGAVELRRKHADLQAEEASLTTTLAATRKALGDNETETDRLNKLQRQQHQLVADLNGKLGAEDARRVECRKAIAQARKNLPPEWQAKADAAGLTEQHQWKVEQDALVQRGADVRHDHLQQARTTLEPLRQEIAGLKAEADAFPEEARQAPEVVRQQLVAAKNAESSAADALSRAGRDKESLEEQKRKREELRAQVLELEREHNYYNLLAQLLGPKRLQLHLMRKAERQIVDYANSVLDRLSGGQLYLRLCGGDDGGGTDRALELEAYNRATGGGAINVAFLSGSQRFRVAVSLALAIGQYASRQHRPIESVIIDEGFGCLDRQGRQVMVQELQNLRGHLHCILLVSHQEEFAEAFSDGYKFELENGATKVTRFQR